MVTHPPLRETSLKRVAALTYPLFVAWPGALGLCAVRWGWVGRPGATGALLELALYLVSVAPVAVGLTILERVIPYRSDWSTSHDDVRTDATYLASNWLSGLALSRLLAAGVAWVLGAHLASSGGAGLWPSSWPLVAQVLLALLVSELGHYVIHRLGHESALLFRAHATHHAAPRLYWFNATRFHLLEVVAHNLFQAAPLLLLGCGREALLVYAVIATAHGWIQHSNVDFRTGPLSLVFSTPELHRWHHSRDPSEGNSNYGALFNVWDQLFGTYLRPAPAKRRFAGGVGLSGMPDFPTTFLAQQLAPFVWSRRARSGGRGGESAAAALPAGSAPPGVQP